MLLQLTKEGIIKLLVKHNQQYDCSVYDLVQSWCPNDNSFGTAAGNFRKMDGFNKTRYLCVCFCSSNKWINLFALVKKLQYKQGFIQGYIKKM